MFDSCYMDLCWLRLVLYKSEGAKKKAASEIDLIHIQLLDYITPDLLATLLDDGHGRQQQMLLLLR